MMDTAPEPQKPKRRAFGAIAAWGVLLILLGVVAVGLLRTQRGQVKVGEPAPNFELTTFDGKTITLEALRGKVVLINLWASWCIPCEREADLLESAWRNYADPSDAARKDVIFLGVAYSDMDTKAKAYLKRFEITYPNGPDKGTRIYSLYRATGVPETYIVDRQGNLAYVKFSEFTSAAEIIAAVNAVADK